MIASRLPFRLAHPPLGLRIVLLVGLAAPLPALAQGTAEQKEACTDDAINLCAANIPDVGKITACMKAHYSQLSPKCRAAFASAEPAPATKPERAAKVERAERAERVEKIERAEKVERRAATRANADGPHRAARSRAISRDAVVEGSREIQPRETETVRIAPAAGDPPYPSDTAPRPARQSASLALLCRDGLIDAYTCANTIPAIGLGE